jgi:hypothetical protein
MKKIKDRKFVFTDDRVRQLVDEQRPAPKGRHFLVIKPNTDGRPCAWGKSSEFADAVQVADEQWDAHGEVADGTGRRTGLCYHDEEAGPYHVHLVSDRPLGEQV